MRRARDNGWTVEISARAWEQLGVVPGDVFRKVKKALDGVASALQAGEQEPATGKQFVSAGGYIARYRTDSEQQAVVVEEVRREESGSDELTSTGRRRRKA